MTYHGQLCITPPGGTPAASTIDVLNDAVVFTCGDGRTEVLPLVDIDDVFDDNYCLRLTDYTGREHALSMLGKAYGQVVADVVKFRNRALEHDLLLTGVNLRDTYPGKLVSSGARQCEVRLFEDLMVVVPQRGLMWGVPYAYVSGVTWNEQLYQVEVLIEGEPTAIFGQMGKRSTQFRDDLQNFVDALRRKSALTLSQLVPGFSPFEISRLATAMPDGRATQEQVVAAINADLWSHLENVVAGRPDRRPSYEWLKARCPAGWAALGIKSATFGDEGQPQALSRGNVEGMPEEGETSTPAEPGNAGEGDATKGAITWFFCPLAIDGEPVNVVAQEVTSESGHATYFFKILDATTFSRLQGQQLADAVSAGISRLNRALATLNFRRQPIYLSDEAIQHGAFARYRVALRRLHYLQWTREAFLGRAIHDDTWENQVQVILEQAAAPQ